MQGAQKQHQLEKIIKQLKEDYNRPIEDSLKQDHSIPLQRQPDPLNYVATEDINAKAPDRPS